MQVDHRGSSIGSRVCIWQGRLVELHIGFTGCGIQTFSRRLQRQLASDRGVRRTGEEKLIILHDLGAEQALDLLEVLRKQGLLLLVLRLPFLAVRPIGSFLTPLLLSFDNHL